MSYKEKENVNKMISVDTEHGTNDLEEMNRNYSFYLFVMMWHRSNDKHNELKYEISFSMILDAWSSFVDSDYNDESIDLHTRISNYFENEKNSTNRTRKSEEISSTSDSKEQAGKTRVFYRKIVDDPQAGEVIAVFLDDIFDDYGNMSSYTHTGQHSGCSAEFLLKNTVATSTGCDVHGCMATELSEQGYNSIETVTIHEMNGSKKSKCLYCNSGAEPTHFICEDCEDGMCDECYYSGTEHDSHYQDPAEATESEEDYLIMEDVFGNGYGCECCVKKVTKMIKNIRKNNED